jgi:hypothetical protein
MPHQYNAGDVVTVFQISSANELVIEGKATIRQDDPEGYVQDFNRRSAR